MPKPTGIESFSVRTRVGVVDFERVPDSAHWIASVTIEPEHLRSGNTSPEAALKSLANHIAHVADVVRDDTYSVLSALVVK